MIFSLRFSVNPSTKLKTIRLLTASQAWNWRELSFQSRETANWGKNRQPLQNLSTDLRKIPYKLGKIQGGKVRLARNYVQPWFSIGTLKKSKIAYERKTICALRQQENALKKTRRGNDHRKSRKCYRTPFESCWMFWETFWRSQTSMENPTVPTVLQDDFVHWFYA